MLKLPDVLPESTLYDSTKHWQWLKRETLCSTWYKILLKCVLSDSHAGLYQPVSHSLRVLPIGSGFISYWNSILFTGLLPSLASFPLALAWMMLGWEVKGSVDPYCPTWFFSLIPARKMADSLNVKPTCSWLWSITKILQVAYPIWHKV